MVTRERTMPKKKQNVIRVRFDIEHVRLKQPLSYSSITWSLNGNKFISPLKTTNTMTCQSSPRSLEQGVGVPDTCMFKQSRKTRSHDSNQSSHAFTLSLKCFYTLVLGVWFRCHAKITHLQKQQNIIKKTLCCYLRHVISGSNMDGKYYGAHMSSFPMRIEVNEKWKVPLLFNTTVLWNVMNYTMIL